MKVSVADAKNKLPELIKAAGNGQRITICRRGKPVVDLARTVKSEMKKTEIRHAQGQSDHQRSRLVEADDRQGS
jgi:antitoxin (DNA-binding transcriptional repressor) of toxin-antitoxin stability system